PECFAKAVQEWIGAVGAKTADITPGSRWENGFIDAGARPTLKTPHRVEPRRKRPSLFAPGSLGWPKSRLGPGLLTRATCRVGFGASTAFRSHSWSPDPVQNSRNLHDRSLPPS